MKAGDAEFSGFNARLHEIESLIAGWDDWLALSNCETQLQDVPRYVDFPENPVPRLENLEAQIRQAREDRDEAAEQLRRAEEASEVDIPGENLLDDAGSIEAIRRARSSFDNSVRDLPERRAELRGMEAGFAENLADLGQGWGETELQSFDTSLVVRNRLERWKQQTTESNERAKQAQFQLGQERRTLLDHESETQEAREKLQSEPPPLDATALTERQDGLRAARGQLGRVRAATPKPRKPPRPAQCPERQQGNARMGFWAPQRPAAHSDGTGRGSPHHSWANGWREERCRWVSPAGWSCWPRPPASGIWEGRLHPPPRRQWHPRLAGRMPRRRRQRRTARLSLLESAAALGLDGQPTTAALESADAYLESARNALDAWNSANAQVEESARREKLQQQRLEVAVREQEAAEASAQEAQQEWRKWLRERELDETLTVDSMTTFLARVETARASLAEARRMRDRVAAIERDIEEVREQVEPLTINHRHPARP